MGVLAEAASQADFLAARSQMALSLGWHIVVACLGVGLPALVLFAEWRGLRTGDNHYRLLARRWAKTTGVLFAVGAASGTVLSFEMGMLWPELMEKFGAVFGLPFTLEAFAFFVEAIFLGVYLYGWDRLPPRAHLLSGLPIPLARVASAFFVVSANAWMNQPRGPAVTVSAAAGLASLALLARRRYLLARPTAALAVAAVLGAWALAQHPVLLPPGLTAGAAAAPAQVLVPMLTVLAGGALLLVPSLTWMYWLFQRSRSRQRAAGTDSRSGRPAAATRGKQP